MSEFFSHYSFILIFLHVISGVIWVGGMIAIRIAVHPTLQTIQDPKQKLEKTLMIVGRLFNLVIPFILFLIITGVIFELALGLNKGSTAIYVHIKEAIWTIMTINFIYMYSKRLKAKKLFLQGHTKEAAAKMKNIPNFFLPLNIFLGVVAIGIGVILRGF